MAGGRVIRATHLIHGLGPGGAEQVLVDLCQASAGVGVETTVLSLMPLDAHEHALGLARHDVPVQTLSLPSRWDVRGLKRVITAVGQTAPDIIHTHMKHADLLGAVAARRLGVPMVSTLHLIEDAPTPLGRAKRALAAQARLRGASRTVAVSDAVRDWYVEQFRVDPARVVTIPNGRAAPAPSTEADRQRFRAELGMTESTVAVAVVGIMRPGKGHAAVLEVARRLARSRKPSTPPIRFLLAGDGPLRAELEAEAQRSGVADDVVFLGYRNDIASVLAASDVLLHASDFDALPTALIEGLAAGLPSVAYAVGGVPEIINADTGFLVEPGNVEGLEAAITVLAEDQDVRAELGKHAQLRFAAEFDATTWAGRLRDLYAEILAGPRP